jgi:hypothetical protein
VTARWQAALAYALTGCELPLGEPGRPDPQALVEGLDAAGWPASRVGEHARDQVVAESTWPHAVPTSLRAGCGAAQLAAALSLTRELLHLTTLEVRPPSGRLKLSPDEERLMREVPPHHGS